MELKKTVQEFLNLPDQDIGVERIGNGLINDTFIIEDRKNLKKYILQKINKNIFKNPEFIVDNHLTVNRLLSENGYSKKIVKPVVSRNGNYLDALERIWRMQEFMPDSKTFLKVPDHKTAYESAKLLSEFYFHINQSENILLKETLPGFIDFSKRINDFKSSLKTANENLKEKAAAEIAFIISQLALPEQWITLDRDKRLPKRIIHADPKISNLLFNEKNEPLAVIDLDTVMNATILYDFGDMVRSYTNKGDEDDGNITDNFDSAIYSGVKRGFLFHLENQLKTVELDNLDYAAQTVIYIQAVRFLTDYLNGSVYYAVKYPEHNLARTRNQINLLKGLQQFLN